MSTNNHDLNLQTGVLLNETIARAKSIGYSTLACSVEIDISALYSNKSGSKRKKSNGKDRLATEIGRLQSPDNNNVLRRINAVFSDNQNVDKLREKSFASFDLLGVIPRNIETLKYFCQCTMVTPEIIVIDPYESETLLPVPVRLLRSAANRGITFELNYSAAIGDIFNCSKFIRHLSAYHGALKGKNLIISSGCTNWTQLRSPSDVQNLAILLPKDTCSLQACTKNAENAVNWAFTRRKTAAGIIYAPDDIPQIVFSDEEEELST